MYYNKLKKSFIDAQLLKSDLLDLKKYSFFLGKTIIVLVFTITK